MFTLYYFYQIKIQPKYYKTYMYVTIAIAQPRVWSIIFTILRKIHA